MDPINHWRFRQGVLVVFLVEAICFFLHVHSLVVIGALYVHWECKRMGLTRCFGILGSKFILFYFFNFVKWKHVIWFMPKMGLYGGADK